MKIIGSDKVGKVANKQQLQSLKHIAKREKPPLQIFCESQIVLSKLCKK